VHTFHQLVGWGDNGRSLVTLMLVERRDESELNPVPVQPIPVPVATSQPVAAPIGPSLSVYFYVHDVATGDMVSAMQVYSTTSYPRIYGLALSPDGGTLAFATTGDTPPSTGSTSQVNLDLWDLREGKLKHRVEGLGDQVVSPFPGIWDQFLAWSPDGATLYLASDATVKVIEVATGKIVRTLPDVVPPTSTPTPAAPPPRSPLPEISSSPGVSATPTPDPGRYYPIVGIELSPSGDRLAVVDYRAIRVWETANGKLQMLTSMPGTVPSDLNASMYSHSHARLTWLADGHILASHFSDYGPGIWLIDPERGAHLRQLAEYPQYVAWSPATNMLAMEVERDYVEIWSGADGLGPTAGPTSSLIP
jgi:WD40 repeat protein